MPDIQSKEALLKEVADIRATVTELTERGDTAALEAKQTEMAEGLDKVSRQLMELGTTRDAGTIGSDERELSARYLKDDGSIQLFSQKRSFEYAGKHFESVAPGLFDDNHRCNDWQNDLQNAAGRRSLARMAQGRNAGPSSTPNLDADVARILLRAPTKIRDAVERALNDSAGVGAEWIPDGFVPQLYREFETPSGLASLHQDVPVTNETFTRPKVTQGARPYIKNRITNDNPAAYTPSTPVTADTTIQVKGLAVRILVEEEASEDSAIAAIPAMQDELRRALVDGYDDAMVNGDTAGTHQDDLVNWNTRSRWGATGLGGSADHRRFMLGFRAASFDKSSTTDIGGTLTYAEILTILASLGERGVNDAYLVTSPEVMVRALMGLTEVATLDKFGPQASVTAGQIGAIAGLPIVLSRWMSTDLAATGLFTNAGALSGLAIVDPSAYVHYTRRGPTLEIQKEIKSGHFELVATQRRIMDSSDAAATKNVAFGFNI